jgi:hypothetical protein
VTCPKCGAENEGASASCVHCGAKLGAVPVARHRRARLRRTGLSLGVVVLVLIAAPIAWREWARAQRYTCVANARQVTSALHAYALDWGAFPPADVWCDVLQPYLTDPRSLLCPAAPSSAGSGYWLNAAAAGIQPLEVPAPSGTVLIFDGPPGWNAAGGQRDLVTRHQGECVIGFVDGRVDDMLPDDLPPGAWDPIIAAAPAP